MRRSLSLTGMLAGLAGLTGCPSPEPSADASESATTDVSSDTDVDSDDVGETESATSNATSESGEVEPWLEVGWGVSEFNEFEDTFPIVVGPQGLSMFSMPLRGAGFYNPPDPGFDNPDMPMLQAWVDIPGYPITPEGHFNEVFDYPALFYPSLDNPGVLEGPAVWLVIPDQVEPEEIAGLALSLHVEMLDADGILLTQDHDLVVGDPSEPPPGP